MPPVGFERQSQQASGHRGCSHWDRRLLLLFYFILFYFYGSPVVSRTECGYDAQILQYAGYNTL